MRMQEAEEELRDEADGEALLLTSAWGPVSNPFPIISRQGETRVLLLVPCNQRTGLISYEVGNFILTRIKVFLVGLCFSIVYQGDTCSECMGLKQQQYTEISQ
jgi:hypothetical protein